MKRILLAVAALFSIGAVTAVFADGEWLRAGPVWVKGIIYAGTSRVAITNSAGNLSTTSLALSGNATVTGNAGITGTLAVTGASTFVGTVTQTVPPILSLSAAVAATGSSKTDCTALTKEYNTMTGTALQGVCLLTAAAGQHQFVYNDSAVSLIVYPLDAGNDTLAVDNFSALAADAGWTVGPLGSLDCTSYTTTAWFCRSSFGARATVAAAGTNQSNGTALTSVNLNSEVTVTGADATVGITLMTGAAPGCVSIFSSAITSALKVYGHNSDDDTIAGGAGDAVFVQTARTRVKYCTVNGVDWLTY